MRVSIDLRTLFSYPEYVCRTYHFPAGASAGSPASALLPRLESTDLFRQSREVRIRHAGEEYRLRITSNNKLILTK